MTVQPIRHRFAIFFWVSAICFGLLLVEEYLRFSTPNVFKYADGVMRVQIANLDETTQHLLSVVVCTIAAVGLKRLPIRLLKHLALLSFLLNMVLLKASVSDGPYEVYRFVEWWGANLLIARLVLDVGYRAAAVLSIMCCIAGALLFWRVNGRIVIPGRCRCCGYDLTGNVSGTCPECGTGCRGEEVEC